MISNSSSKSPSADPVIGSDDRSTKDASRPPVVDVRSLVGDGKEALIIHKGDRYRLRITANDKLILTK